MNILQVIPYFYPAWAYGGTPRVVFGLCKELVKQRQNVVVYTTDTLDRNTRVKPETRSPHSEALLRHLHFDTEIDGIKVRYFKNVSNHLAFTQKLFLTPTFPFLLKEELKHTDIVHLQEYRTLQNVSAWHACKKRRIPYVISAHGAILRIMGREKRKGLFDKFWGYNILRDADKLIALTELEGCQYREFEIDEGKIEVVPNGIDLSQFSILPERGALRTRYGLEDYHIVLYVGRIHRIKGLDVLIAAFAELRKEGVGCKLIIAGPDDGFRKDCGVQIADCGLKQIDLWRRGEIDRGDVKKADVIFTGMVNGNEKLSLFIDADVTVVPSRFENFPSVPFESLMCGTPIIVSSVCGVAEMIKGAGAGYLAKAEDKIDLREEIWEVLSNTGGAKISVEKGRRLIRDRLSWQKIALRMMEIYEACLR